MYCDLSRLTELKNPQGEIVAYKNTMRPEEGNLNAGDFDECKKGDTLGIVKPLTQVRQVIQLCDMPKVSAPGALLYSIV